MNYNGSKLYKNTIAGGSAGITSLLTIYPTEYIKTQVQLYPKNNFNTIIKNTYNTHGLNGFYRGMSSLAIVSIPRSAVKYTSFEVYRHLLKRENETKTEKLYKNFLSGALSGFTTSFCVSLPSDNIKIKSISLQNSNKPSGLLDSTKNVYKDNGLKGFYKGALSNSTKECITYASRFALYGIVSEKIGKDTVFKNFISGGIASMPGPLINNPLDVIQTRMQSNYDNKYKSNFDCAKQILKNEGIFTFWKGASLRTLRTIPGMGVSFMVYEEICKICHF
jgi:solute carrier family 25 citrate transporter 1